MARFITLNDRNVVIAVRNGMNKLKNEIESELGEIGQICIAGGIFINPEPTHSEGEREDTPANNSDLQKEFKLLKQENAELWYEIMMGGIS